MRKILLIDLSPIAKGLDDILYDELFNSKDLSSMGYVDITEDHSIMIIRDNIMQSIKPADILKTDKFVKIIKG